MCWLWALIALQVGAAKGDPIGRGRAEDVALAAPKWRQLRLTIHREQFGTVATFFAAAL